MTSLKQVLKILLLTLALYFVFLFLASSFFRSQRETKLLTEVIKDSLGQVLELAEGGKLYYELTPARSKSRGNILLLHGYASNTNTWQEQVKFLTYNYSILNVDLLGFGKSIDTGGRIIGPDDQVVALEQLLSHLGMGDIVVIGHSYGGGIAQRFALDHPNRISSLILISPVDLSGKIGAESLSWMNSNFLLQLGFDLTYSRVDIERALVLAVAEPSIVTNDLVDLYYQSYQIMGSGRALIDHIFSRASERLVETGRIDVPTLVVYGEEDTLIEEGMKRNLELGLQNVEFIELSRIGHLPQHEDPVTVNQLMKGWLDHNL